MAPTWVPRWSQNEEKIDAKIDRKFDTSWDRFLGGFEKILGARVEPSCWHPNHFKIDANCEKRLFEKSWFFHGKNHYFQGSGGPGWEQKSIKTGGQHGKAVKHRFSDDFDINIQYNIAF